MGKPIIDNTKFVVARKNHICTICGEEIIRGIRYLSSNELTSEGWSHYKAHEECSSTLLADTEDEREFDSINDNEDDLMNGWVDDPYRDDFNDDQRLSEMLNEFIY